MFLRVGNIILNKMILLNKVKSSALWYIIGYFAADGNLSIDGRHLNITSKDRKHLYLIRKALNLKSKIGRKARSAEEIKKYSFLQFGDRNFYKYLLNIGFTHNKSLTLGAINVEKQYFADFLRGVIDGDGSISTWIHHSNQLRQWSLRIFSGSTIFIEWLRSEIEFHFGLTGKIHIRKQNNRTNAIYVIKFGKRAAMKILKKIYYPDCLSLERKYLQAQLCLQS